MDADGKSLQRDVGAIGSLVIAFVTLPVTVTVCALSAPAQNSHTAAFTAKS